MLIPPSQSPHSRSFYDGHQMGQYVKIQTQIKQSKQQNKSPEERKSSIGSDPGQPIKAHKIKKRHSPMRTTKDKHKLSKRKFLQVPSIEVAELQEEVAEVANRRKSNFLNTMNSLMSSIQEDAETLKLDSVRHSSAYMG